MRRILPAWAVLTVSVLALAIGAAQVLAGFWLIRRSEAFFRVEEEKALLSLAQDYSRRLIKGETDDSRRNELVAQSEFITRRGAFISAYSRYGTELALRWTLAASAVVVCLAAAAFVFLASAARAFERSALQAEAVGAKRQWETTGRVLAHEIKNALSPVALDLDFLSSGDEVSAAVSRCTERMKKNLKRVSTMVNSFREFSELPVPAFRIASIGSLLAQAAGQAGLSGMLDPRQLEGLVGRKEYTDPEYLTIVFANLLKNAKEAGASTMRARMAGRTLSLRDDGPGLSPEMASRLTRGGPRPGMGEKPGGDGMGLYIVFEICRMLGIAVTARNAAPGFEVSLEFGHG
jgi:signal transduction histidine kinase